MLFSLALSIPASEWGLAIVNTLIFRCIPPQPLLRLEYKEGVAADAATMVIVPTFISEEKEIADLVRRLRFIIWPIRTADSLRNFRDFCDAKQPSLPEDDVVLNIAQQAIEI